MTGSNKEHPSNMGFVCDAHAPKPDPKHQKGDAKKYIGHFVKKCFVDPQGRQEHMWLKVTKMEGDILTGVLNNDPVYIPIACGDVVTCRVSEIEAFCK